MRAEDATALAMILSELVQNAVEHGLADRGGHVDVKVDRVTLESGEDELTVVDHRRRRRAPGGLPAGRWPAWAPGSSPRSASDLRGPDPVGGHDPHGTRVVFACQAPPAGATDAVRT